MSENVVERVKAAIIAEITSDSMNWFSGPENPGANACIDAVVDMDAIVLAAMSAHIAALSEAGYVLVPREASDKMIEAGALALQSIPRDQFMAASLSPDRWALAKLKAPIRWRAMISAALSEP